MSAAIRSPRSHSALFNLNILIDAIDGTRLHTSRPAEIVSADATQTALDGVFLNHVPDHPKIVSAIIMPAGEKQLLGLGRRFRLAFTISKP